MTESEAKIKFCPLTFIGVTSLMSGSLDPKKSTETASSIRAASSCINTECMMWRWNLDYNNGQTKPPGGGYCGLGGKP